MKIDDYLNRWQLSVEGDFIITNTSRLLPVTYNGNHAMLKIALSEEERAGASLMVWWAGDGAARVFEHEGDALLMERAIGKRSLVAMAKTGQDDEASLVICQVVAKLHSPKQKPLPASLVPLSTWFRSLFSAAGKFSGIFAHSAEVADELLRNSQDIVALHGDIHHQNILDSDDHGWIAIDPKGLLGERGFDYANLFCNPDSEVATNPGRLARQVKIVAKVANLHETRLLQWILAYAGLSAAWSIEEGDSPDLALTIAHSAKSELARRD